MSTELVDGQLAQRTIEGDFEAFEELVERYSLSLFKFAYKILNDYEDASDVLQQTLIQLYTALPQRHPTASFRSWAFVIARNKCVDYLRKRQIVTLHQLEAEDPHLTTLEQLNDPSPLPEELIERQAIQELLLEAIRSLPERYQLVVTLRYTTYLSFGEIGQVLNIPEGSAKTFFQRAKILLRDYLKDRL